jgi:hypothetical protein
MATINHKTYNEATETFKDFSVYDGKETLIFKVDGSEGNVGIGTSSPTDTIGYGRALDIQSSTGAVVYLRDSNAPTTQYGFLAFDGTDNGLKLHNANSSGFLRFDTNATERLRITSAGNVGIGNSSPPTSFALGSSTTGLSFTSASSSLNSGKIAVLKQVEIGSGNGDLTIETYAGGAGGGERMRITSAGDVGIGTSAPDIFGRFYTRSVGIDSSGTTALQIDGTSYSIIDMGANGVRLGFLSQSGTETSLGNLSTIPLVFQTNSGERMRITSAGNVGIGTSSPTVALEVNGAVKFVDSGAGGPDLSFGNIGGSTFINNIAAARNYYGAYEHVFTNEDNSIERVRINSDGNVGIGTSNPVAKLESLDGDIKVTTQSAFAGFITSRNTIPSSGGTQLGRLQYSAYSTGTTYVDGAAIQAFSTEAWSASSTPSWLSLQTVASGSTSLVERVRIDSDGLKFNGDTAAANALDDYEEGTFTPTYANGLTGVTYTNTTGKYTKIGRAVHWSLRIQATAATADAANVQLGGFPFASGPAPENTGSIGYFSVYTTDVVYMYNNSNSTNIVAFYKKNADPLIGTDLTSVTGTIHCSGTYFV